MHEHFGVMGRVDIITSTLGKALGGAGAIGRDGGGGLGYWPVKKQVGRYGVWGACQFRRLRRHYVSCLKDRIIAVPFRR